MKILDEPKVIRLKIMDFLSRREHSSKIYQKLSRRVESKEMLLQSIEDLKRDGYLAMKGLLELFSEQKRELWASKDKNELIQRGVKEFLYSLNEETDWPVCIGCLKKMNGKYPEEQRNSQTSFLNYRGFEFHHWVKHFTSQ